MNATATRIQDLIPIAVVIAAGCEPCAERMVRRALENGADAKDIRVTLGAVAHLHAQECFAHQVGADVVARMEKPLARGKRVLTEMLQTAS